MFKKIYKKNWKQKMKNKLREREKEVTFFSEKTIHRMKKKMLNLQ